MKNQKSLKDTLIEMANQKQAQQLRAELETAKLTARETEERFVIFFGRKPEKVEGLRATFDGITVSRSCGSGGWSVIKNCPECKTETNSSYGSTSLQDVGEEIKKKDDLCWTCKGKHTEREKSVEDKLLTVLRDFIYENSPEN